MCYPASEFRVGDQDVRLGRIAGCPFYMGAAQFEYWRHTQLIIDAVPGRGSGFSLEAPLGVRFLTRSRVFTDAEAADLERTDPAMRGRSQYLTLLAGRTRNDPVGFARLLIMWRGATRTQAMALSIIESRLVAKRWV